MENAELLKKIDALAQSKAMDAAKIEMITSEKQKMSEKVADLTAVNSEQKKQITLPNETLKGYEKQIAEQNS